MNEQGCFPAYVLPQGMKKPDCLGTLAGKISAGSSFIPSTDQGIKLIFGACYDACMGKYSQPHTKSLEGTVIYLRSSIEREGLFNTCLNLLCLIARCTSYE